MLFGICDIRNRFRKTPKEFIDSFYKNNIRDEVLIIGHSPNGTFIYGLGARDLIPIKDEYLIWVYACLCGNSLCPAISKSGIICIGHTRNIMSFKNIIPLEIPFLENNIPSMQGKSPRYIENEFKKKLLERAKKAYRDREFALATIINFNRTSLRAF